MPKKPMDYVNTVIYRIVCNDTNVIDSYIGSTTNFSKRKSRHKDACINIKNPHHNYPVYKSIRENGNWENWSMVMIEMYPCASRLEAERREREHVERLEPTLNKYLPGGKLRVAKATL